MMIRRKQSLHYNVRDMVRTEGYDNSKSPLSENVSQTYQENVLSRIRGDESTANYSGGVAQWPF